MGRIPVEMENLMIHLSSIMFKEKPDILLFLGDRYEMLEAASIAVALHVPIAHISGARVQREQWMNKLDMQLRRCYTFIFLVQTFMQII